MTKLPSPRPDLSALRAAVALLPKGRARVATTFAVTPRPASALTEATVAWLERYTIPEPTSGCWIALLAPNDLGYVAPRVDGKRIYGHRSAYELQIGPIPAGTELDHLCFVRSCWNPFHLEPVSHQLNQLRAATRPHWRREKVLCAGPLPRPHVPEEADGRPS